MEKMKDIWLVLWVVLVAITLNSCSSEAEVEEEEAIEEDGSIVLSEEQISNGGIEFEQLVQKSFDSRISVNGRVGSFPENKADVSSYFSGNIVDISVVPGQQVNKGDQLFVLENPDFIGVQEEYLLTKIEEENFQIEYDRQKGLSTNNITSLKSLQKAEKELLLAQTKLSALSNELALMNINTKKLSVSNITSKVAVYAPISGVVSNVFVNLGSYVTPAFTTLAIVREGEKVLEFELFEKNIASISAMNKIYFSLGTTPQLHEAEVISILPVVDGNSKSMKIYAHPLNVDLNFSTGMYVGGEIEALSVIKWCLPTTAVVKEGGQHYVWLKTDNAETLVLTKMYVEPGISENGFTEILNYTDFPEGAEVVAKGAFNL